MRSTITRGWLQTRPDSMFKQENINRQMGGQTLQIYHLSHQGSPNMPDMSGRILKCPTESSSTAGHDVWQRKVHMIYGRKLPICWTSGSKMSDRESKCPAEHRMSARHFVWHTRNNFGDHWCVHLAACLTGIAVTIQHHTVVTYEIDFLFSTFPTTHLPEGVYYKTPLNSNRIQLLSFPLPFIKAFYRQQLTIDSIMLHNTQANAGIHKKVVLHTSIQCQIHISDMLSFCDFDFDIFLIARILGNVCVSPQSPKECVGHSLLICAYSQTW